MLLHDLQLPREQLNMQMEYISDLEAGSSISQTQKILFIFCI